jgi:hypothetical protein
MYTHLNSDLNDKDFTIHNDNDDLDESIKLVYFNIFYLKDILLKLKKNYIIKMKRNL